MHWVNWKDRLWAFSQQFKPEFMDPQNPGLKVTGYAFPDYTMEMIPLLHFPVLCCK
jgi:hypothetical protein